jgi:retron-type reverse transcriptase
MNEQLKNNLLKQLATASVSISEDDQAKLKQAQITQQYIQAYINDFNSYHSLPVRTPERLNIMTHSGRAALENLQALVESV